MCHAAEWLTAIGTIFLGVVALFVALFQEHVKRFWFKPRIDVAASSFEPYAVKKSFMKMGSGFAEHPHYSLKISVTNNGNTEAKYMQVFAENLERQDGQGRFVPASGFKA